MLAWVKVWMEEENGKVDLQALGIDEGACFSKAVCSEGDPWSLFKLLDENAEGVVSQVVRDPKPKWMLPALILLSFFHVMQSLLLVITACRLRLPHHVIVL